MMRRYLVGTCLLLLVCSLNSIGCGRRNVVVLPSDTIPILVPAEGTFHAQEESICMSLGEYKKVFDGCADSVIPK